MSKYVLLVAAFLTVSVTVRAQNCDALKLENGRLKFEIAKLRNEAAGKRLDATLTQTQSGNDIDFKLINAVGDKKSQTVTVVVRFTNKTANKTDFSTQIRSCTSVEGEEFTLKTGMVGKDNSGKTLFTDAPLMGTYVFAGILPKVNLIKVLPVPYGYTAPNSRYEQGQIVFRDIPIEWK